MKCSCGLDNTVDILKDGTKMIRCANCDQYNIKNLLEREIQDIKQWIVKSLDEASERTN